MRENIYEAFDYCPTCGSAKCVNILHCPTCKAVQSELAIRKITTAQQENKL